LLFSRSRSRLLQRFTAKSRGSEGSRLRWSRPDYVLRAMQTVGVSGNVSFSNKQKFTINSSQYIQDIAQSTTMDVSTTSREGILSTVDAKHYSYPLTFLIDEEFASDGSATELNTSNQVYQVYQVNRG
jgi:hypothetical protein